MKKLWRRRLVKPEAENKKRKIFIQSTESIEMSFLKSMWKNNSKHKSKWNQEGKLIKSLIAPFSPIVKPQEDHESNYNSEQFH